MRTGIATVPLDYGRCPPWLFRRMKRLSRGISLAIIEEFGTREFLRRLSDPVWFQSFGCVLSFDWNSSGLTTTTLGALKEGLRGLENDLGLYICGGKGKTSRRTPDQIQNWGEFIGLSMDKIDRLVYASKISAKVDSSLIQDGFNIYHHNLIFSKSGEWAVVQQGMSTPLQKARRYHWLSSTLHKKEDKVDYIEEPHSGIASDARVKPLDLTAKESNQNREISKGLVAEEPNQFFRDFKIVLAHSSKYLASQNKKLDFADMNLNNIEFKQHPILNEKFDLKGLEKRIQFAHSNRPESFEEVLSTKGVGPKTVRALSLVAELIYGAKPSYEDPARYTFAHGGKDGTPFFVDRETYDKTIDTIEKGIKMSKISSKEKVEAQRRLNKRFS